MQTDRVNLLTPSKRCENFISIPVEYTIYAQVLETLLEVCKEDFEGTIKYLNEEDPKIQDIAAVRFSHNHQLKNISKRTKIWSGILFNHKLLQEELPLLFKIFASQFTLEFHNLSIQIQMLGTNITDSRFMQLKNMCNILMKEIKYNYFI